MVRKNCYFMQPAENTDIIKTFLEIEYLRLLKVNHFFRDWI